MKPVLVVVDVQNGFISEHSAPVVPAVERLLKTWSSAGRDTVCTRYFNTVGSQYERLLHWTRMQGSPETDLVPAVQALASSTTAVIDKHSYSFLNDEGSRLVREHGWTDLYICGIATESCVLKTAVDAFEDGLTPWIVVDASASHAGPAAHEAGLLVAKRFIGSGQLISEADARP